MNWKLLAQGKGFKEKTWRDVAVPESVQSWFELSIHFPVFLFSRELFLEQFTAGTLNRQMYGKFKTRLDTDTVISHLFAYSSKWHRKP